MFEAELYYSILYLQCVGTAADLLQWLRVGCTIVWSGGIHERLWYNVLIS